MRIKMATTVLGGLLMLCGNQTGAAAAPESLTVEMLSGAVQAEISDPKPEFGWTLQSPHRGEIQTAYRVLVASSLDALNRNEADTWDSGKVESDASVDVEYAGKPLQGGQTYHWKVKAWLRHAGEGAWSAPQTFRMGTDLERYVTTRHPLCRTQISPEGVTKKGDGHFLVDFGKVAFGHLSIELTSPANGHTVEVHLGERGDENGVNRKPGGTIRYYKVPLILKKGTHAYEVHPPKDKRNTGSKAVKLPPEFGTGTPFRYVELINCPGTVEAEKTRQVAVHYRFDESAASFSSANKLLDDIWDLCKYSMKATSFVGVYVDGDRERIPYEADAYINQLSHYAVDREYALARYSHEYLLIHPTWPTEWKQHSVLMAWVDYMYTGNTESLAQYYGMLKKEKTLENRARADGLLNTKGLRDIVDWPRGERDGYDFKEINTVVNAFYYQTLLQMADMARALDKTDDAAAYAEKAAKVKAVFNEKLFDAAKGVYIDGEGSSHASLHANMMPLAFGLVPDARVKSVADFVESKGMACSVYGAQYLLEALYVAGRPEAALSLMTSEDIRSWANMLRVGSTITLEAWDNKFKPNQDWNHAWGAAPGNIIARFVVGVQPLEPGFKRILVKPQLGTLASVSARVPTIRGPVDVQIDNARQKPFKLTCSIPANTCAQIYVPAGKSESVLESGKPVSAQKDVTFLRMEGIYAVYEAGSGTYNFTTK